MLAINQMATPLMLQKFLLLYAVLRDEIHKLASPYGCHGCKSVHREQKLSFVGPAGGAVVRAGGPCMEATVLKRLVASSIPGSSTLSRMSSLFSLCPVSCLYTVK